MIYVWLVQLIIAVVFFVVGELMRPKPDFEDAEAVPFEELPLPQINPQRKQAVIWGRVRITAPQVMDITEYETVEIKKKIKTGMFSSSTVVTGHRYFMGTQLGVCKGVANLRKIFYDDVEIFSGFAGSDPDGVVIDIDLPDFLGGKENGGGIVGRFRWFAGGPTQNVSVYLAQFQTPTPAYRYTAYMQFEKVEVGETPDIRGFSFEVERYPDPVPFDPGIAQVDGNGVDVDSNMMAIAVELLTDSDFGFALPLVDLNTTVFNAVATVLHTEKNAMSLKWVNNQTIERLIDQINKQSDGILRFDPKTGKWEYKLIRDDFVVGGLTVLNESNIKVLKTFSRANWDETINYVEINYLQRESKERPSPAKAYDQSNFNRQGRNKALSLTFPGLYSVDTANNIASREIRTGAFALSSGELIATRVAWDLLPGDPFIIEWPQELGITQYIARVGGMGFGDSEQTEIQMGFLEDIFKLADNVFAAPPGSLFVPKAGPPVTPTIFDFFDQPHFFNFRDQESILLKTNGDAHKPYSVVAPPQSNALSYRLLQRITGSLAVFNAEAASTFLPSGVLNIALAENTGSGDLIVSLQVDTVFLSGILADAPGANASEVKVNIQDEAFNLAVIVSTLADPFEGGVYEPEIIAYEDVVVVGNTVTLTNVRRALMDTLPIAANAGDRVWFITGDEIDGPGTTAREFDVADSVDLRLTNQATTGESPQTATSIQTFRNRVNRPYNAGDAQIESQRFFAGLITAGGDVDLSWSDRDRLAFDSRTQYQDDANVTIETGIELVIRIFDAPLGETGGSLVRKVVESGSGIGADGGEVLDTYTGNTYTYTNAKQITDGGGEAIAKLRIEIRTTDSAEVVFSILDINRVVNVDVPLNFLQRGPIFDEIQAQAPIAHYPLGELTGNFVDVEGNAPDLVINGDVGRSLVGPDQYSRSVFFEAGSGNFISMADDPINDMATNIGIFFWFRCAEGDGVGRIPLFHKGSTVANDFDDDVMRIGLSTTGFPFFDWRRGASFSKNISLPSATTNGRLDDGQWHNIFVLGSNPFVMLVDGMYYAQSTGGGTLSMSSAQPLNIGNMADATVMSNPEMEMSHIAIWENDSSGTTNVSQIQNSGQAGANMWRAGIIQRRPYLRKIWESQPAYHLQLGDWEDISHTIQDMMGQIGQNAFSTAEFIAWDNATHAAADLRIPGPFVGQESYGLDKTVDNRIDVGNLSVDTNGGLGSFINDDNTEFSYLGWIKLPVGHAATRAIWVISTNLSGQRRYKMEILSTDKIRIYASFNGSNGSTTNAYLEEQDGTLPEDEWLLVGVTKTDGERARIYVNGELVASTETVNGTATSGQWIDQSSGSSMLMILFDGHANAGETHWIGEVADQTCWPRELSPIEVKGIYGAALSGELTMERMLARDNPEHRITFDSSAAPDDIGNIAGTPTATGTFETDDTLPIEADPGFLVEVSPLGFRGGERLEYGDAMFENQGFLDLDDVAMGIIGRNLNFGVTQQFWVYNNESGAGEASFDMNMSLIQVTNKEMGWDVFPDSGGTSLTGATVQPAGGSDVYTIKETGTGGGKVRKIFKNQYIDAQDAGVQDDYTGVAVDRLLVGDRNTDDSLPVEGDLAYLFAYDRIVSDKIIRRIGLRFKGYNRYLIAVLQHNPEAVYQLEMRAPTALFDHNYVQEESPFTIRDLALLNSPTTPVRAIAADHVNPMHVGRGLTFASASSEDARGVNAIGTSVPFVMGGWFRVDSGVNARIAISLATATNEYVAVGIINDVAGITIADAGSAVTRSSGAVVNGTTAFIVVVVDASNNKSIYLNGVLQVNDTNADTLPSVIDTQSVNSIIESTGASFDNGSYTGLFFMSETLTAAEVMEIYSEGLVLLYEGAILLDSPSMLYRLDEYIDSLLKFEDILDVTLYGTGTGLLQGQTGLITNRPGLCVDFDGTGDIDLVRTDYVTGSAERAYEFWLESGFQGTVFSLGANVDAQALVVEVNASGELSINIRGASNLRRWDTGIDTAGSHHVIISLLTAGDSLHDFEIWVDGVEIVSIITAGNDTVLATTATLALTLGNDVTDIATADGNGKMSYFLEFIAELSDTKIVAHFDASQVS